MSQYTCQYIEIQRRCFEKVSDILRNLSGGKLWHFIGPSCRTFSGDAALNLFQEYWGCNASWSCLCHCLFEEAFHCNVRSITTFRGDPEGGIHLRLERRGTRDSGGVLRTVSASSRRWWEAGKAKFLSVIRAREFIFYEYSARVTLFSQVCVGRGLPWRPGIN